MKLSELNYSFLTDDDKYELVMNGVYDLAMQEPTKETKSDLIIVLGCSPNPLEARIKKMMTLYRKGYGENILLTGGNGWQKLYKKTDPITGKVYIDEKKRKELLEAIRQTIGANLLGTNPTEKELALFERFNEGMKQMIHEYEAVSFEKHKEDQMLKMNEAEFMKLMILSNGGLRGAKIFHEPFSYNTKENMQNTEALLNGLQSRGELQKLDSIIVVTSSFHCRRVLLTFKKRFPNIKIIASPSTLDMEKRGVASLGKELLENKYYKEQIEHESDALINYSKNGSIADVDLREILPENIIDTIISRQKRLKNSFEH